MKGPRWPASVAAVLAPRPDDEPAPPAAESVSRADQATVGAMFRYFLRLGALGFGGPVALAGYMQRDLVEERGWVDPQEYRDGLTIAQMAPGPLAAQLAIWLAFIRTGVRGATLAAFAFVGPAFLKTVTLGWLYVGLGGAPWVGSLFYGVAPAAIAIIAVAAYRLLPITVGRDPLLWAVAVAVGMVTFFTQSEVALAFLAAGLLLVVVRVGPKTISHAIDGRMAGIAIFGPLLPATAASTGLLVELALFFVKAGAFVFGSGLAIVPFLHQGVVVEHGWLTEQQFLDAVAIGLITPGPVVITATFIGFLVAGLPGALVCSVAVFLPAYVFVIVPGHWFLRHKGAVALRAFVAGVSAAAAGAIVAATVILGQGAIRDATTLAIGPPHAERAGSHQRSDKGRECGGAAALMKGNNNGSSHMAHHRRQQRLRELTSQLLERGDRVMGTVRRLDAVADLVERNPDTFHAELLETRVLDG